MFKIAYGLIFVSLTVSAEKLALNWLILPEIEIGKVKSSTELSLTKLCTSTDCVLYAPYYSDVIAGIRVENQDAMLIAKLTGIADPSDLEESILNSSSFKRFETKTACRSYARTIEHSSPQSFGMSNESFVKVYVGYVPNSGWVFDENEVIEFCDGYINFKRVISF